MTLQNGNPATEVALEFYNIFWVKAFQLDNGQMFASVKDVVGCLGETKATLYDAFRDPDTGKSRIKCRSINGESAVPVGSVITYWSHYAEKGHRLATILVRALAQKSMKDRVNEAIHIALPPVKLGVLESMEARLEALEQKVRELEGRNVR
ncbi:MAG: hypothetical protein AB1589_38995 [Cyanobacteriota bacterium]